MNRLALILLTILLVSISGSRASQTSNTPTPTSGKSKRNPPTTQPDHHSKDSETKKETPQEPVAQTQTPNSQTITYDTSEKTNSKTSSDWWIVGFTGLLVLVGACQIIAMLRQEKWMRKTVALARQSADTATATVETMKDTAERQLRAYVHVVQASRYRDDTGVLVIRLIVKNTGQTPAYQCSHFMVEGVYDPFPAPHEAFENAHAPLGNSPIGPGESTEFFVTATDLQPAQIAQIMASRVAIYLFGEITYRDAFRVERRITKFRLMCVGDLMRTGRFAPCDEGNEAT